MKPTPQVSQHSRTFPLTDYSYQLTAEAPASATLAPGAKSPFHKLSSEFFRAEMSLDYIAELFFFILITGLAAWPIMSMLACLAWMKIAI